MNNNNPNDDDCEWNLPHRILARLSENLTKAKSESSFLGWTPVQLFVLLLSAIVVTISVHCFNQSIKTKKSHHTHRIHRMQPVHGSETFESSRRFGRNSVDSPIEFNKPHNQYAGNSDPNRTGTQSIHQTSNSSDKGESLRIIIKTK